MQRTLGALILLAATAAQAAPACMHPSQGPALTVGRHEVCWSAIPGASGYDSVVGLSLATLGSELPALAEANPSCLGAPRDTTCVNVFGWGRGDYWFPDVRSLGGAAAMFIAVLYPYVYLLARTAFLERPASLLEAARTMGLDARRAFWRIDLPLARPAVAGGIALALMETLADYGTVAYFSVDTFTTGIYRAWFSLGDRVAAAQLSATLLAFVFGAVLLERWSRGAARVAGSSRQRHLKVPSRAHLTGWRAWTATAICAAPS